MSKFNLTPEEYEAAQKLYGRGLFNTSGVLDTVEKIIEMSIKSNGIEKFRESLRDGNI